MTLYLNQSVLLFVFISSFFFGVYFTGFSLQWTMLKCYGSVCNDIDS